MATKGERLAKADATEKSDWKENLEEVTYQELNRIPNINMLKKPAWFSGKISFKGVEKLDYQKYSELALAREALEEIEPVEYRKLDVAGGFWKSILSLPMLFLLTFPFLAVFALTLSHYGAFPDSITPYMFKSSAGKAETSYALASCWVLALVAFVPWSATVCRLESWMNKYL